jgi:7-keto-8-aminopelargonate synthetase-like enzyme
LLTLLHVVGANVREEKRAMEKLTARKEELYRLMKYHQGIGVAFNYLDSSNFTGRKVSLRGQHLLHFANCCYLGLEIDPRLKAGAIAAIEKYGPLLSNSRAYLSSPLYQELEHLLAQMLPGHQVITTTTTLGHCSALPALIEKDDVIIADIHAHNSLQMAAKQCVANGTTMTYLRRHNDMNALQKLVNNPKYQERRIWFLGDGVYSMQGEFLDLRNLKEILDRHRNVYAYIDDAHGFSWTGNHGAGYVMGNGNLHPQMIVAVSMCKSFGSFGGILTFPNRELRDRVAFIGQTQLFSAPIPPPLLGASIASANIHLSPALLSYQGELAKKIRYFKTLCHEEQIPLTTQSATPIQFIEIGDNRETSEVNARLIQRGIYCSSAAYPAMPKKHGGLRISLSRHLEYEDIEYLIHHLKNALQDFYGPPA